MEYLNRVLGIRVVYKKDAPDFVNVIKKHMDRIRKDENAPVVLILEQLTYRQKEYLLRAHIPFIVEEKQIYLPFMAVYLQERGDGEKTETTAILPTAQLLLLFYVYHGCGELLTSTAAQRLGFTATSISRASRQLEEMSLIQARKQGVHKIIFSDKTPEQFFTAAKKSSEQPVKRTVYVPKAEIREKLFMSGYSALSEYSVLSRPVLDCRAADSIALWKNVSSGRLQNSEEQCAVELWRYDPWKLADGSCVDRLSLALSLSDDRDERVEACVDEMRLQVCRDIDGKRN